MDLEDVLLLLGLALVVAGVALLSIAAASIVAGIALVTLAFARSRRHVNSDGSRARRDA